MKWYESNPERFEIEKRLLARHHRGSKLIIKDGEVKLAKRVATGRDTYDVEGIFACDHPYTPMSFYIRRPSLRGGPPHRYGDGGLCLHNPGQAGPETTGKIFLDWTIQWILTYERWLDGEPWPETNEGCPF
jgi:hypothetical protein